MRYVPAIKKLTLVDPENRGGDYLKWSLIDRHFEELKKARGKTTGEYRNESIRRLQCFRSE